MITIISKEEIFNLLKKQLDFFQITNDEIKTLESNFDKALNRIEYSFSHNSNPYFNKGDESFFSPFHSGQWSMFLFYLSNTIFKSGSGDTVVCDKVYYLNKMLNACDLLYSVDLPSIYMADHPVGAVMGKGKYNDFFSFCQGCTVGNNNGVFPVFGKYVTMMSNAKILGNCNIGNNVIIGANTYIIDNDIPDNSIVFGSSPNLIIKENKIGKLNFK